MKNLIILSGFFIGAPITLLVSIVLLLLLLHNTNFPLNRNSILSQNNRAVYAAVPSMDESLSLEIIPSDAKEESLRQFFSKYKSPLVDHTHFFMLTAEKYGLDYRLLPAIAMQETNLCLKSREGSHNCWGYNVTGKNYRFFDSYEQAIDVVARTLALHYRDKLGRETPEEIMRIYTPSSNGSWAKGVNFFMGVLPDPNNTP